MVAKVWYTGSSRVYTIPRTGSCYEDDLRREIARRERAIAQARPPSPTKYEDGVTWARLHREDAEALVDLRRELEAMSD